MGITEQQRQKAEAQQQAAAKDSTAAVRVVAGPGTGKSHTIELRVAHVLSSGANPAKRVRDFVHSGDRKGTSRAHRQTLFGG
jgi:hypothetical protein